MSNNDNPLYLQEFDMKAFGKKAGSLAAAPFVGGWNEMKSHGAAIGGLAGFGKLNRNFRRKVFRDTNKRFLDNILPNIAKGALIRGSLQYVMAKNKDTALDELRIKLANTTDPREAEEIKDMINKIEGMSNFRFKMKQGAESLLKGAAQDAVITYGKSFYDSARDRNARLATYGKFKKKKDPVTGKVTGLSFNSSALRKNHGRMFQNYGDLFRTGEYKNMNMDEFNQMMKDLRSYRVSKYDLRNRHE